MKVVINSHESGSTYIELYQEGMVYKVDVFHSHGNVYGYPETSKTYTDIQKATKSYNRYIKNI